MVATWGNTGIGGGDASANAAAGDDTIEAGEGNNLVAGEALATGANGGAKVDNTATATEGATATAGNDSITSGAGNDFISGDALAMGSGGAVEVTNSASASSFASAGSAILDAGAGHNLVAGYAMSFTADATLLNTPPPATARLPPPGPATT